MQPQGDMPRLRHLPMRQAAIPFRSLCCSSDLFRIALIASLPMLNSAQVPTQASVPKSSEFHLLEATIDDIHAAMKSGRLTCRSLVGSYIRRIEAYNRSGPGLNAIQNVNTAALREADRLDAAFRTSGLSGLLHCIPVVIKDQIDTHDLPTTYGSILFRDFVPPRDATVVSKIRKAGAIVIAKSTMGEFAAGYLGSGFGVVRNAYDPARYASGSSGGTGTAVAANLATVGIGEDTGGSIRGPAAVNNLVGLRPTTPLISRYGALPSRPTMDTLGPITRTVRDTAILLDVLAGYDSHDLITAYAVGHIPPSFKDAVVSGNLNGTRLGVIREPMDPRTDPSSEEYKKFRYRDRPSDPRPGLTWGGDRRSCEHPRSERTCQESLRRKRFRDRARYG